MAKAKDIEVLKDGLTIGGRTYNVGDILDTAHHTHDVVQAADRKSGALVGYVRRMEDKLQAAAAHHQVPEPAGGVGIEAEA